MLENLPGMMPPVGRDRPKPLDSDAFFDCL
jgi:hypothetical protein